MNHFQWLVSIDQWETKRQMRREWSGRPAWKEVLRNRWKSVPGPMERWRGSTGMRCDRPRPWPAVVFRGGCRWSIAVWWRHWQATKWSRAGDGSRRPLPRGVDKRAPESTGDTADKGTRCQEERHAVQTKMKETNGASDKDSRPIPEFGRHPSRWGSVADWTVELRRQRNVGPFFVVLHPLFPFIFFSLSLSFSFSLGLFLTT